MSESDHSKKKAKKHRKSKNIVSFDSETFTKEDADKILLQTTKEHPHEDTQNGTKKSKKRKKAKTKLESAQSLVSEENEEGRETEMGLSTVAEENVGEEETPKPKKRKKLAPIEDASGDKKKTISIRQQKREKHVKLITDKKTKSELALQEKSLNYLSKWKHARSEWKFEKLRQVWLQQNMFEADKIPEKFWDCVLEYFAEARGKVRDMIVKEAVEIVNKEESDEDKLVRARAIIGVLQE